MTKVHTVYIICVWCVCPKGYSSLINKLLSYTKVAADYYKKYSDFAVVIQPGFKDGTIDSVPLDFLSNVRPSLFTCSMHMTQCINAITFTG